MTVLDSIPELLMTEALEQKGIRMDADERKEAFKKEVDPRFDYHSQLPRIQETDFHAVRDKDISYGASWKKRGGVGAFMMLARKWDRLEEMLKGGFHYDVLEACRTDMSGRDGTVLAEVRDLRRYLLLVEAECAQLSKGGAVGPR